MKPYICSLSLKRNVLHSLSKQRRLLMKVGQETNSFFSIVLPSLFFSLRPSLFSPLSPHLSSLVSTLYYLLFLVSPPSSQSSSAPLIGPSLHLCFFNLSFSSMFFSIKEENGEVRALVRAHLCMCVCTYACVCALVAIELLNH